MFLISKRKKFYVFMKPVNTNFSEQKRHVSCLTLHNSVVVKKKKNPPHF